MTYTFKQAEELAWVGAIAVITFGLELLMTFEPETITDWRTYGIAAGAGAIRAFGGALFARLGRRRLT